MVCAWHSLAVLLMDNQAKAMCAPPQRPITLDGGGRSEHGWYDLTTLQVMDHPEDAAGLRESAR